MFFAWIVLVVVHCSPHVTRCWAALPMPKRIEEPLCRRAIIDSLFLLLALRATSRPLRARHTSWLAVWRSANPLNHLPPPSCDTSADLYLHHITSVATALVLLVFASDMWQVCDKWSSRHHLLEHRPPWRPCEWLSRHAKKKRCAYRCRPKRNDACGRTLPFFRARGASARTHPTNLAANGA